jgi:FkbM family methyltransferase
MNKICIFENYSLSLPADSMDGVIVPCLNNINPNADKIKFILSLLKPSSNILDIGANIGTITIPLAAAGHNLYSIEALPYNFDILKNNMVINKLQNIKLLNVIASNNNEESYIMDYGACSFVKKTNSVEVLNSDSGKAFHVQSIRLDDIIDIKQFDFIKIDIEGSEVVALQGMPEILKQSSMILFECNEFTLQNFGHTSSEKLCSIIESSDYDIYIVDEQNNIRKRSSLFNGQLSVFVDYLAVKKGYNISNGIIGEYTRKELIRQMSDMSNHDSIHFRGHVGSVISGGTENIFTEPEVVSILSRLRNDKSEYVRNLSK